MKLGMMMEGMEEKFIESLVDSVNRSLHFVYMEIGVFTGGTFLPVYDKLAELGQSFEMWGIDPGNESRKIPKAPNRLILHGPSGDELTSWTQPLDFVFIDGCHSKKCVMNDFVLVEPHVKSGGLVVFHDFSHASVGSDFQSHCQERQNVRGGVEELGLMDNKRPGWIRMDDWIGEGTDCGVFKRV